MIVKLDVEGTVHIESNDISNRKVTVGDIVNYEGIDYLIAREISCCKGCAFEDKPTCPNSTDDDKRISCIGNKRDIIFKRF